MHQGAGHLVTRFCNRLCRYQMLVCISGSAPAIRCGQGIADGVAIVYAAGNLRAHPSAGEARFQDAAFRSPSTPLPKSQANPPMRMLGRRYFLAIESPRGGVPRVSAANEKEKSRVKIESSVSPIFRTQPEGGRHVR